jgi:hypothetical protein
MVLGLGNRTKIDWLENHLAAAERPKATLHGSSLDCYINIREICQVGVTKMLRREL